MCIVPAMKYLRFRRGSIAFIMLAALLIAYLAISSLLSTEQRPKMFFDLSGAFASDKLRSVFKKSINVSDNTSISSSTKLRMIERESTTSWRPIIKECHSVHKQLNSCHRLPNFFLYDTARPAYENSIINFWHVEKTGGTTIEKCFIDVYNEPNLPETLHAEGTCSNLLNILSNKEYFKDGTHRPIVRGHNTLALCDILHEQVTNRKCSVFAVFREPYDMMVSFYFFCRQMALSQQEQDNFFSKSLRLPLLEWVKQVGSVVLRKAFVQNWQISEDTDGNKKCRMVQDHELVEKLRENEEFMDNVLDNLDKYLSVVGLYEELSITMRMLQRVYDIPFYDNCSSIHVIKGGYEGLGGAAREELRLRAKKELMDSEEIRQVLKFDFKVYEKAKELFEAQKIEFFRMETGGKPLKDVTNE